MKHNDIWIVGVVPQDTVLFNNTIKYNIQYGKIDAPEADIILASKYADIHERILTFPDGYETQVNTQSWIRNYLLKSCIYLIN